MNSNVTTSSVSARAKEKAKIAELLAERSMLKQKFELKEAEEQFALDLEIAKAQARERAFSEIQEEENKSNKSVDKCKHQGLPEQIFLPHIKREPSFSVIPSQKFTEYEQHHKYRPLDPEAPEFFALPPASKTKIERAEATSQPTPTDKELLKQALEMQQAQIRQMISSQHLLATALTLPQPEVPKFKGDPMEFQTFILAFDARVQSEVINSADRLYYLDQHLLGEPKELIGGCLHVEPSEGYVEVRRLLQREYGDPYQVSSAYMQKLASWPPVKHDDGPALKHFSLFLTKCNNAMKEIAHMSALDHPANMQTIVQKLPGHLQAKWRDNVAKTRRTGNMAGFKDITLFVQHAAESANDPIYGIDALNEAKLRLKADSQDDSRKFTVSKYKSTSFATNLDVTSKSPSSHGAGFSRQNITRT